MRDLTLIFSDLTIGDQYAQALAEGLKIIDGTEKLALRNNNLSDIGIVPILKSLKKDLIVLDISQNQKIST